MSDIYRVDPARMRGHLDEHVTRLHVKDAQVPVTVRRHHQIAPQAQGRAGLPGISRNAQKLVTNIPVNMA